MNLPLAAGTGAQMLAEIGGILIVLAVAARFADRIGFSPIPIYLMIGLALGELVDGPRALSPEMVEVGAQIGVVLLLFMLGLEFSGEDLGAGLRTATRPALLDGVLNFTPGFAGGLLLGWDWRAAVVLGGVSYISSSGVISKLISDLGRIGNRETPAVLSLLVMEDLVMAVYLPLLAVLLAGTAAAEGAGLLAAAVAAAMAALLVAIRFGATISRRLEHRSDEVLLLTALGVVLLISGMAEAVRVSAAVGAFLAGIVFSDTLAQRAQELIAPLRDLFAAVFFVFFGAQIVLADVPTVLPAAIILALITAVTKVITGWNAAKAFGAGISGRVRAGTVLIARGEFSIVIAGIAVAAGIEPQLGPLAASYVLITALLASFVTRWSDPIAHIITRTQTRRAATK